MRISASSSDVCSSDLIRHPPKAGVQPFYAHRSWIPAFAGTTEEGGLSSREPAGGFALDTRTADAAFCQRRQDLVIGLARYGGQRRRVPFALRDHRRIIRRCRQPREEARACRGVDQPVDRSLVSLCEIDRHFGVIRRDRADDRGADCLAGFVGQRERERALGKRLVLRRTEQRIEGAALDRRLRCLCHRAQPVPFGLRSEEHTSELQSLMRISYAVFCLKTKTPKE